MENKTEKENVEGLMKPRFKVIADYPMGVFGIGDIIQPDSHGICYVLEGGGYTSNLNKYPAIFKPLHWSEEIEEMPEYVKNFALPADIFKVDSFRWPKIRIENANGGCSLVNPENLLPATKEEYESYLNKNK